MLIYLLTSLTSIESDYPGCGLMLAGDFNRLKVNHLLNQFQCKQMVNVLTRAYQSLDLIITNLYSFYAKDSVEKHPPFVLSDHIAVILNTRSRCAKSGSRKLVITRDMRPSRKRELGRYLTSCKWSNLDHLKTCEEKLELFTDLINLGINIIMPNKRTILHVNDPPWKRQAAFSHGNNELFRYYRNRVNRERKICREKFYSSKVEHLKKSKRSRWWKKVKQIAGMTPSTGAEDLYNQLLIDDMGRKLPTEIANFMNTEFLDPIKIYQPLASLPPYNPNDSVLQLVELDVYKVLASLNPRKASGPDGVSNWVLNEYAETLAQPVCSILNSNFNEQQLPTPWKTADIVPIIKSKRVTKICKHLRPISLTPALSKVAEESVVSKFIGPAILSQIDLNQLGVIPKYSTSMAAISMIHNWSQSTDGSGAAVRIVLFDYKKVFDLIDHGILTEKISRLPIPKAVVRWTIDFLLYQKQRVKLVINCISEWGDVPAGVPQGTKLGP